MVWSQNSPFHSFRLALIDEARDNASHEGSEALMEEDETRTASKLSRCHRFLTEMLQDTSTHDTVAFLSSPFYFTPNV
jgi:hypothetical protein